MTKAVIYLQDKLTSEPILILPRLNEPFQVETDASGYGVGGVLAQERKTDWLPVAYFSQRLSKCERNYSTSEKELYAIVLSVEYFRQFLYGISFKVITDHKPLQYLLTVKEPASRLLRWLNRLSMYDYQIWYRKGIKNGNADGLSRLPTEEELNEQNEENQPIFINLIKSVETTPEQIIINVVIADSESLDERQLKDKNLEWLYNLKIQAMNENKHHIVVTPQQFENQEQRSLYAQWNRIFIIKGILYRAWKSTTNGNNKLIFQFIVPKENRENIMNTAHDKATTGGHLGIEKVQNRISQQYYWPGWRKEVREYILSCDTCQRVKISHAVHNPPMQIIESRFPFEIITSDIAGEFKESKRGNKWILVIVDHFTKWADAHAMPDATAKTVANCLIDTMLKYGFADQIITDQGTNYQSELLQHMYDLLDTYKTRTTAYHPQADGNSEAFVKQIKQMIACYIEQPENQRDWDEKLKFLIFAYNTATHSTTGFSPFEAMTGRIQKLPSDLFDEDIIVDLPYTNIEFIEHLKNKFSSVYKSILENRAFTMNKAKLRHDRVITGCNFKKRRQSLATY